MDALDRTSRKGRAPLIDEFVQVARARLCDLGGMSHFKSGVGVLAVLLACTAAGAAPSSPPIKRTSTMQEFALIFRPGRAVDPADVPRRNTAAREWALALRREGTLHAASPLEDGGVTITQQGVGPVVHERAVASVLVVEARDLESAVALAKGHPGLAFGTEIEVRPVKVVPPAPR
jgi:hypothetical protein